MGHREDLLAGAKRCLYQRGYAHTTARDIVKESGTNLASIGYHFGSMKALLNAAMMQAIEEWSEEIGRALAADAEPTADPLARFEAVWARVIESFGAHRQLWTATLEVTVQAEHSPELRAFLAEAVQEGRLGLAVLFQNTGAPVDEHSARTIGSFYQALMTGVVTQWLIDPQRAPSARDLVEALRIITGSLQATGTPGDKRD